MTNKFEYPNTASNTYSTILNRSLNNKRISAILPLLVHDQFVSDFFNNVSLFNNFF